MCGDGDYADRLHIGTGGDAEFWVIWNDRGSMKRAIRRDEANAVHVQRPF